MARQEGHHNFPGRAMLAAPAPTYLAIERRGLTVRLILVGRLAQWLAHLAYTE
jgi:hypothetical protein